MLIIIDANILNTVVNNNQEYTPLFKYVSFGNGTVAWGGRKYKKEVKKCRNFFKLIIEWDNIKKLIPLDTNSVDSNEAFLVSTFRRKGFDDHHILAMAIFSGAELICSVDRGLHALVKTCYSTTGRMKIGSNCIQRCVLKKPKLYQGKQHIGLLI